MCSFINEGLEGYQYSKCVSSFNDQTEKNEFPIFQSGMKPVLRYRSKSFSLAPGHRWRVSLVLDRNQHAARKLSKRKECLMLVVINNNNSNTSGRGRERTNTVNGKERVEVQICTLYDIAFISYAHLLKADLSFSPDLGLHAILIFFVSRIKAYWILPLPLPLLSPPLVFFRWQKSSQTHIFLSLS